MQGGGVTGRKGEGSKRMCGADLSMTHIHTHTDAYNNVHLSVHERKEEEKGREGWFERKKSRNSLGGFPLQEEKKKTRRARE